MAAPAQQRQSLFRRIKKLKKEDIMIPIKKNRVLVLLAGVFILLFNPTNGHSRIHGNGSSGGYTGEDGVTGEQSGVLSTGNIIERYVIEGAGYYLNAYAEILAFLNRVEVSDVSGMDYIEAQQMLDSIRAHMGNALKTYYFLIRRAEVTPYNPVVIARLMDFDYTGFMEKWNLNSVVFNRVEELLGKGDITGMYKYIYAQFTAITEILNSVNADISMGKMPPLSVLWRLNESCSQTMLFGQYVSRVFYTVLEIPI
jgi:hypothetical protein